MTFSFDQNNKHEFHNFNSIRFCQQLSLKLRRNRYRFFIIVSVSIIFIFYIFGIFVHPFELDFENEFQYPLHTTDFRYFIENVKQQNLHNNALKPINNYSYSFHLNPNHKCNYYVPTESKNNNNNIEKQSINNKQNPLYPITLLLVIKSAACNFLSRNVIRQTWGNENRFSDVTIRTVFMLGECTTKKSTCENEFLDYPEIVLSKKTSNFRTMLAMNRSVNCQQLIDMENEHYDDIIQADFIDSYYNNTRKTMASLQWTAKYCSQVPFMFFVDDDYYVSIKNLLKFSRNFLQISETISATKQIYSGDNNGNSVLDDISKVNETDDVEDRRMRMNIEKMTTTNEESNNNLVFDGRLYAGFVFNHSRPHRHVTSKWYVNLDEYPYNRYPPYVTGGCFLVNNLTTIDLYYASLFTQPFKYDDVYLGILANKMQIHLLPYNDRMHFYKLPYDSQTYGNILASHGYHNPQELWQVWNEQKSLGNA